MKAWSSLLIAVVLTSSLTGCLVRTRSRSQQSRARSCPPAYHWERGACVHNGHKHDKHRHDKHRR